jgi:hypothetical protein
LGRVRGVVRTRSRDNIAGGVSDGGRLSRLYGDVEIARRGADGRAHQSFGAYIGVHQPLAWSSSSFNQRFALSYTRDGWNLTANAIFGIQLDSVTSRPQTSPCPAPFVQYGCNPDFINLDLTTTRKFDRWELGPVVFGSSDLTRPLLSYAKTSQVAAGGLIGYDFGHVRLQVYLTREIYERNYGGLDTRIWGRVTLPL